jgi:high affinity Mn2+ porin
MFQGFGLAETHGLGGFSNGEAQKGGTRIPQVYIARYFFRQVIGLGGETEKVADDFNQLPGIRDISRITLTAGRFAVNDIFDNNAYAHDPRTQFMNHAIFAAGAFDYAADQKGYGGGLVVDFNRRDWAFRTGYLLLPIHSNAITLSHEVGRQGQIASELELRYKLMARSGILRLLGWTNRATAGSYREALADPNFDGDLSIDATHKIRTQYGFGINLEQSVTDAVGFFARYSWRDGKSEVMSWTDIDASTSAGFLIKGTPWGRKDDAFGIAVAYNQLSKDHRDYTAAGGVNVLIGDGRLSYSGESILETFYAFGLRPNQTLTFDYQYVTNPAYNTDRGPVSIFSGRIHGQF